MLPPDFVIEFTTPPPKRPYSAEIAPVEIFVSWIASSTKRFSAWPRRFSLMTTPLTRYSLSNESAPAIMMLPLGPLPASPGARSTASCSARPTGSSSSASFLPARKRSWCRFRKGTIVPAVIAAAADAARAANAPLLVDPKVPLAERYPCATLITPNHHEAELMTQQSVRSTDDARKAARRLHEMSGASVLITWGEHGMWVLDMSGGSPVEAHLPAAAREVADVTGALLANSPENDQELWKGAMPFQG